MKFIELTENVQYASKQLMRFINLDTPTEKSHRYLVEPPFTKIVSKQFL